MAKITALTPAQEADLAATYQKWLAIGRSTAPLDRPRAEAAITAMYAAIGKPAPAFMSFTSPAVAMLAIAVMRSLAKDQLWDQLGDQLGDQLWGQLGGQLGDQLWDQLNWSYFAGQHWCAWEVFYDFCNRIGVTYTDEQRSTLNLWLEQSQACHWWWPMNGVCILTERHTLLTVDDRGRLHNESGPAAMYADGWALFAWHGLTIPRELDYVIHSPQQITVADIEQQANSELRRVMIDRYGAARFVADSGAIVVHEIAADHPLQGLRTARLLRKEVPDDEPLIYVDLLNSTPEPDGSTKRYMLRVDPEAYGGEASRNAHAAAASTWRNADKSLAFKRWQDYVPLAES